MNNFWRYVIKEAVEKQYSWERIIKAFPELDDEVIREYFDTLINEE